jgi:hypothetical protein
MKPNLPSFNTISLHGVVAREIFKLLLTFSDPRLSLFFVFGGLCYLYLPGGTHGN